MKVKSFVAGLAKGIEEATKLLDGHVAGLGNIKIHSSIDTVYDSKEVTQYNACSPGLPMMVRVVVYEKK
ncbi:hypothetical protein L6267_02455 [Candidatus Parcubacteria bacterium]|nr:hypothetical protein [Candidatus Parcubacteria bacterium]